MGKGGGFLQVRTVMNLMNLESPVACLSTKGASENELDANLSE
jgi:hypothetical protein